MRTRTGTASPRTMTMDRVEEYLEALEEKGYSPDSLDGYRRKLKVLYAFLGEDKRLTRSTLPRWREALLDRGYAEQTVNAFIYVANSYLDFVGLRECQLVGLPRPEVQAGEELTRTEYLRLLSTARLLEKEQVYLLVKTFALTGLAVQDLPRLTAEAVRAGEIALERGGLSIPACLREELLSYAKREGIARGPIFVTKRERKPLGRTVVTGYISQLCQEAQVPMEKGSPRCLRRLYQSTRREIEANVSALIRREQDRLAETEQNFIGWQRDETIQRLG